MTRYETFSEVAAKYCLTLGLDEQTPVAEWETALKARLNERTKALAAMKNSALRQKTERECADLRGAAQLVSLLVLFDKLRRCVQQDKQETFEWEWAKPEHQSLMPSSDNPIYEQYLDIKGEARRKWPGIALGPAKLVPTPSPAARSGRTSRRPALSAVEPDERLKLLKEQLAAGLPFNPRPPSNRTTRSKRTRGPRESAAGPIRTFQDLYDDPYTAVSGLKAAKDYFKRLAGNSETRQPKQEVAFLLYFVSILVARVRLGVVITTLSDADVARGIRWGLDLGWLDPWTRDLLVKSIKTVT